MRALLLALLAAGILSAMVVAVSIAATGADAYAVFIWQWPASLPVILGAGWGLYFGQNMPVWPNRMLMVCGGVVGCMFVAVMAAGLATGQGVDALGLSIGAFVESFTMPLSLLQDSDGAPLSLPLYVAACWGLVASALWKGWLALRARRVALGLLLGLSVTCPALAWVPMDAQDMIRFENEFASTFNAGRHQEAQMLAERFMQRDPARFRYDTRELAPENLNNPQSEAARAIYLFWRVRVEGSFQRYYSIGDAINFYGGVLVQCAMEWRSAPEAAEPETQRRYIASMRGNMFCQRAAARFPSHPSIVEIFSEPPRPSSPPPAVVAQAPTPSAPPSPAPAPRPSLPAAAPSAMPVPASPAPSRPSTTASSSVSMASWRTFDMLMIGAAAFLGLGWWAMRRKQTQGGM